MQFAEPSYFYCIVPLVLLGVILFMLGRIQQVRLQKFGAPELIRKLSATVNWRGRRWQVRLWYLALLLLIVTLARPQWGSHVEYIERRGVEVMVVLDVSESMMAEDFKPNRLARAKLEVSELMDSLGGNDLGLVLFSGAAFIQFPLTSDFSTARMFLDSADPEIISRPGTVIGEAIDVAMQGFNYERATQKVIVLLTDGENHEGDAVAAAENAAEQGVLIYTIGFGSVDGEPIPIYDELGNPIGFKEDRTGKTVLTRLDELTLQQVSNVTNGLYFRARPDGREVTFLADEIGKLRTAEMESRFETRGIERFQWFLAVAIFALIIIEIIPDRVKLKTEGQKPAATPLSKASQRT
jgi:Ca-activated chloride channel family protein